MFNIKIIVLVTFIVIPIIPMSPTMQLKIPAGMLKYMKIRYQEGGLDQTYDFIEPASAQEASKRAAEMRAAGASAKYNEEFLHYAYAAQHFWKMENLILKNEALEEVRRLEKENAELKKQLAPAKEALKVTPPTSGGPQSKTQPTAAK